MSNDPPLATAMDHREGEKTFFSKRSRGFVKALGDIRLSKASSRAMRIHKERSFQKAHAPTIHHSGSAGCSMRSGG
jgi:hypothetical protein